MGPGSEQRQTSAPALLAEVADIGGLVPQLDDALLKRIHEAPDVETLSQVSSIWAQTLLEDQQQLAELTSLPQIHLHRAALSEHLQQLQV